MIELKNIEKTYKSKKGKNTKALDNVSLCFDNKGVTFILGKSGSGKSTLLNIIGGLDKYDSGDMIILGKSSKDFTQADFDSYRNTYVGFIFQEFNILEDYDVYQNIVLALQLQQKDIDEKEINELLEKLELTDLKKRKVNELSGGQKQRVAIARALVKDPKIILADEPTGNLDSKTGRQVMELLQEISKEKLVIIVSHDEEYAEKYGDRIIEIKDGKVVNDTKEVEKNLDSKNTYKTIKSKLPLKDSFKLGIGSLKYKKVKLFFTILLTIITLGFFSCTDTLSSYNFNKEHAKILSEEKEQFVQVEKYYYFHDIDYPAKQLIYINEDDIKEIESRVNKTGYRVYNFSDNDYGESSINNLLHIVNDTNSFYSNSGVEIVVSKDISKILKENIIGRKPESPNEIVISNSVADKIIKNGIEVYETVIQNEFKVSNVFEPKTYEDILNTQFTYHFGEEGMVKIVGIINYDETSYGKDNIVNKIYVSEDFISNLRVTDPEQLKSYFTSEISIEGIEINNDNNYTNSAILNHELEYYNGNSWVRTNSLNANEVIININQIVDQFKYSEELNNYTGRNYYGDYDALKKRFFENYIREYNIIGKKVNLKVYYDDYGDKNLYKEFNDLTIVGIYDEEENSWNNNNYFSSQLLQDLKRQSFEQSSILYPVNSKSEFMNILKKFNQEEALSVKSTYSETIEYERTIFNSIKKIASYAGLIFLVFAIFLIGNFIITSISYRKKEIGVLRALGSRSKDVAKIFLWEGVIIAFISGTIASVLLVIVTNFLNSYIMDMISIITTPFLIGIRQFVVIYLLVFAVTFISSIIPIIRISKMKPIDAILNK